MRKELYSTILIFLFSFFFIFNCAGSREEGTEDYLTEEERQQKELDDIEALLGISNDTESEEPKEQQPQPNNEEKLNLLDTNEIIDNSQPAVQPDKEKKDLEQKISRLESQIKQKDRVIADLNAELTLQDNSKNTQPSSFSPSTTSIVSDISVEEYQSRYDDARNAFENRNYDYAIQLFESLLSASSSHSLSDNAQYWIGECHYALRQYDAAIIDFEKVFTFANSNKQDDAQYKLGLCYIRKGDREKAREELDRLLKSFPNSEYVARAESAMAKL